MAESSRIGISVIICCYNSAKLLPETLRHIAQQKIISTLSWELIIVNNNSDDNTVAVANHEWGKYPLLETKLKVVEEPTAGLTNARKKGWSEAKHEYIIFCDDDNWLDENYLENAWSVMQANPEVGAAGGRIEAVPEDKLPDWWEEYKHIYAVGKQSEKPGNIAPKKYIWGAGMVVRKSLLRWVFDDSIPFVLIDRKGRELSSGGDGEICARLLLMHYKLWYDERLFLYHYMPENRLTGPYRDKLVEAQAAAQPMLNQYEHVIYFGTFKISTKIKRTIQYTKLILQGYFDRKIKVTPLKATISYMWARDFWNVEDFPVELFRIRDFLVKKSNLGPG
jgi:glycosyltransferase involved in cell wall biosynthesis